MSAVFKLHLGDCIATMRGMADASINSIVTDPPYHLTTGKKGGSGEASVNLDSPYGRSRIGTGFMGMTWDGGDIAQSVEMWSEALRVLKPGGHLLAFSGSRTYHRMVCAIEDAGFDIRDQIMWLYASGFPKSHNLDNHRGALTCGCAVPYTHDRTKPQTQCDMRDMQHADVPAAVDTGEGRGQVLQPGVPQQGAPLAGRQQLPAPEVRAGEPSLERRRDAAEPTRQLSAGAVCAVPAGIDDDGASGRLCDGTSAGHGAVGRAPADAPGNSAPHQPHAAGEPADQSRTVAGQQKPQTGGAWSICRGCGKPVVPKGLGTALKPAHEPIVVARKPLIGTVAANVLAHGTGALNIDGCRVGDDGGGQNGRSVGATNRESWRQPAVEKRQGDIGRWPANLIHDGSDEVLAAFPQAPGQMAKASTSDTQRAGQNVYSTMVRGSNGAEPRGDVGSAARFFYCAKASKADREDGNVHPTVKPTDLMAYLVRLVTPPGGTVLDPFTGSGSTGKACMREGFNFVGCELSPEYLAIAKARIEQEQLQAAIRAYDAMLKAA